MTSETTVELAVIFSTLNNSIRVSIFWGKPEVFRWKGGVPPVGLQGSNLSLNTAIKMFISAIPQLLLRLTLFWSQSQVAINSILGTNALACFSIHPSILCHLSFSPGNSSLQSWSTELFKKLKGQLDEFSCLSRTLTEKSLHYGSVTLTEFTAGHRNSQWGNALLRSTSTARVSETQEIVCEPQWIQLVRDLKWGPLCHLCLSVFNWQVSGKTFTDYCQCSYQYLNKHHLSIESNWIIFNSV